MDAQIQAGGLVVLWSATETQFEAVRDGLDALGLGQYRPERRTDEAALRDALETVFQAGARKDGAVLVRPVGKSKAFEVVRETSIDDRRNQYEHLETGYVESGLVALDSSDLKTQTDVAGIFDVRKQVVSPGGVSSSLVRIVGSLSGTPLRSTGGVYWLPIRCEGVWAKVAQVFETAGSNAVYIIRTVHDADACRAILAAVTAEIQGVAAALDREITSGELGVRALEGRGRQASALREKVAEYEGVLGQALTGLRAQLETVENAAAAAALLASAQAEAETQAAAGTAA